MKILNKEYKLNQILTVGYLSSRGYWVVTTGRLMDYKSDKYIVIDYSYDYQQMEDVVKIDINKVKYVYLMPEQPMWR